MTVFLWLLAAVWSASLLALVWILARDDARARRIARLRAIAEADRTDVPRTHADVLLDIELMRLALAVGYCREEQRR